jgi:hypothetical protein
MRLSLLHQFLYFFCPNSVSILWNCKAYVYIYKHTWLFTDCIRITVTIKITLRVTQFYTVSNADWVFITTVPVWWWLGDYVRMGKMFYSILLKQEAIGAPNYWNVFCLIAFEEAIIRNIIILKCINYIIITLINNNVVINDNYGRLQDRIMLFQIPMGTWKDFSEIYRKFGHTLSKKFARPAI